MMEEIQTNKFDFNEAVQQLLAGKKISGKDGVLAPLVKQLVEAALEAEVESHITQDVLSGNKNRKNGKTSKTTLQMPFSLLAEEHYHLLPLPKPYLGIHPKVVNVILSKNKENFKITSKINTVYIPNRDMQSYDEFIPSLVAIATINSIGYFSSSINAGVLWN